LIFILVAFLMAHSDLDLEAKNTKHVVKSSVADPDPGSGAFLTPGSGINIPDPQHW
jgi:hypothetical protein